MILHVKIPAIKKNNKQFLWNQYENALYAQLLYERKKMYFEWLKKYCNEISNANKNCCKNKKTYALVMCFTNY